MITAIHSAELVIPSGLATMSRSLPGVDDQLSHIGMIPSF
jgi:hypothetical protein